MFLRYITIISVGIIAIVPVGAFAGEHCTVEQGPYASLADYSRAIDAELSELQKEGKGNACPSGVSAQNGVAEFGRVLATIPNFEATNQNFMYSVRTMDQDKSRKAVLRDAELFTIIIKNIRETFIDLGNKCALDAATFSRLQAITKEAYALEKTYKQTAIGYAPGVMTDVRGKHQKVWEDIITYYNPGATEGCTHTFEGMDEAKEFLTVTIEDGEEIEKLIQEMQKIIMPLRDEHVEELPTKDKDKKMEKFRDFVAEKFLTMFNKKEVLTSNFDCQKSQVHNTSNAENVLQGQDDCAEKPVGGTQKYFQKWMDMVVSSPSTTDYAQNQDMLVQRFDRNKDIVQFYTNSTPLISREIDNNASEQSVLMQIHSIIAQANTIINDRIKPMQKNCMKGQPDIVGACKSQRF